MAELQSLTWLNSRLRYINDCSLLLDMEQQFDMFDISRNDKGNELHGEKQRKRGEMNITMLTDQEMTERVEPVEKSRVEKENEDPPSPTPFPDLISVA